MNQEQMENTIQFLLDSHARFFSDIEELKASQQTTTTQIQALVESQQALTDNVEAMRLEMREAFDNLIIANEVTRKLTEDVAKLAIGTSQRVTRLEEQNGNK